MWICVGPRDPSTKPSRGWLRVGVSKPQLILAGAETTANKVTTKTRAYCRGCFSNYLGDVVIYYLQLLLGEKVR